MQAFTSDYCCFARRCSSRSKQPSIETEMTLRFLLLEVYSAPPLLSVGFVDALTILLCFLIFLSIGFYPKSYTKSGNGFSSRVQTC